MAACASYGVGMGADGTGTTEFGRQLRGWRQRRRLSQLELAALAATTSRHVSFLETGRSRPGTDMVRRLADALEVPPREQNALLEAAGLRAAFPHRTLDDRDMTRYRAAVDALLRAHEPLPAAVVDRYGAVHRANDAFERLMPGLIGVPPETLVDSLFGPGPFRQIVVNFDEVAASWLARQRHEARRTGDPRLEALIDRAQRLIGPLPRRESNDDEPVVCSRLRIGEQVLALYTIVVRFDTATDVTLNELRVELLHPANTAAEHFFGVDG